MDKISKIKNSIKAIWQGHGLFMVFAVVAALISLINLSAWLILGVAIACYAFYLWQQKQDQKKIVKAKAEPIITESELNADKVCQLTTATAEVNQDIYDVVRQMSPGKEGKLDIHVEKQSNIKAITMLVENINTLLGLNNEVFNKIIKLLEAIKQGKLYLRIKNNYPGLYGELVETANSICMSNRKFMQEIANVSSMLSMSAKEIFECNTELRARTEEQARYLQDTAMSMAELTELIRATVGEADKASSIAMETQDRARQGGDVVHNAVEAMDVIKNKSEDVVKITDIINDIAFQTNLLALNAEVEAARAGSHGAGFAVVANEIRELSYRTSSSADSIKKLIIDSNESIKQGSQLVAESGSVLEEIVASVEEVVGVVKQMTQATQMQSIGLDEINKTLSKLNSYTQKNKLYVAEVSAVGDSMEMQSNHLCELLQEFQVTKEDNKKANDAANADNINHEDEQKTA